jgi:hypothetical protein
MVVARSTPSSGPRASSEAGRHVERGDTGGPHPPHRGKGCLHFGERPSGKIDELRWRDAKQQTVVVQVADHNHDGTAKARRCAGGGVTRERVAPRLLLSQVRRLPLVPRPATAPADGRCRRPSTPPACGTSLECRVPGKLVLDRFVQSRTQQGQEPGVEDGDKRRPSLEPYQRSQIHRLPPGAGARRSDQRE